MIDILIEVGGEVLQLLWDLWKKGKPERKAAKKAAKKKVKLLKKIISKKQMLVNHL